MKNKYLLLFSLFMMNFINAQTNLTFTIANAIDNGNNISESITTNGLMLLLLP